MRKGRGRDRTQPSRSPVAYVQGEVPLKAHGQIHVMSLLSFNFVD